MKLTKELVFDIPDEIWDFLIREDGVEETEKFIVDLAMKGVTQGLEFGYHMAMGMKMGVAPQTLIPKILNKYILDDSNISQEIKDELVLETEKHVYRLTSEENKDDV